MSLLNSYHTPFSPAVLHNLPGMDPSGFASGDVWRQHTLSQGERERLDDLVGQALIDQDVHDRLLIQRDPALFGTFNLSDETRRWCATVQANTLKEFAQAIIAAALPHYNGAVTAAI
jgi:hypothetical protein